MSETFQSGTTVVLWKWLATELSGGHSAVFLFGMAIARDGPTSLLHELSIDNTIPKMCGDMGALSILASEHDITIPWLFRDVGALSLTSLSHPFSGTLVLCHM